MEICGVHIIIDHHHEIVNKQQIYIHGFSSKVNRLFVAVGTTV